MYSHTYSHSHTEKVNADDPSDEQHPYNDADGDGLVDDDSVRPVESLSPIDDSSILVQTLRARIHTDMPFPAAAAGTYPCTCLEAKVDDGYKYYACEVSEVKKLSSCSEVEMKRKGK